jgi:hypothetical protein
VIPVILVFPVVPVIEVVPISRGMAAKPAAEVALLGVGFPASIRSWQSFDLPRNPSFLLPSFANSRSDA